jgi:hypothetical protein
MRMNLKSLTNRELDQNLMNWVKAEKKALNFVISHIAEVDRRKMYLEYAYPSLRAYLEERLGYDGGSAQRRIDAARLSHSVPAVIESLHQGEIKLSQVTVLQRTLREVKDKVVSKEEKCELVEAIKNKSVTETQSIVAKALNVAIKIAPKITSQADESVRFEVSLSKAQWVKFNKMRELLSNKVTNGDWSNLLEYLSDKVIQQKLGKDSSAQSTTTDPQNPRNLKVVCSKESAASSNEEPKDGKEQASLYQLKKQILRRDGCCQFKNKDGKMCGSKWHLEVDHMIPKWAGGKDVAENLRALCGNHNRYVYRKQANIKTV